MAPDPLRSDWVADSGATSHFANNRSLFSDLKQVEGGIRVSQLTGPNISAKEMGTVKLQVDGMNGKQTMTLHNVILNEKLQHNIFSLQQARKMGYEYEMGKLGSKIRLIHVEENDKKVQMALMTECAGRWTLDTATIPNGRASTTETFLQTPIMKKGTLQPTLVSTKPNKGQHGLQECKRNLLRKDLLRMSQSNVDKHVHGLGLHIPKVHHGAAQNRLKPNLQEWRAKVQQDVKLPVAEKTENMADLRVRVASGRIHHTLHGTMMQTSMQPALGTKSLEVDIAVGAVVRVATADLKPRPAATGKMRHYVVKRVVRLQKCAAAVRKHATASQFKTTDKDSARMLSGMKISSPISWLCTRSRVQRGQPNVQAAFFVRPGS